MEGSLDPSCFATNTGKVQLLLQSCSGQNAVAAALALIAKTQYSR